MICKTCNSRLGTDGVCSPCEETAQTFESRSGVAADADYAYHELAHHIVLFRALPRCRQDWRDIEDTIAMFPIGRAQIHELRVLATQAVAARSLGWNTDVARLVEMSSEGLLRDVVNDSPWWQRKGKAVVTTEKEALARVRKLLPLVSSRNVRLYSRAVRSLRGEVVSRS